VVVPQKMAVGIAVIDYGLGNIRSVGKALEAGGAEVAVTSEERAIKNSAGIVFPGVGAFARGMENVRERGLLEVLIQEFLKGKPFLGICLGLQLLFTESEEHGHSRGFDVVGGVVRKFTGNIKIPHIGWNTVKIKNSASGMFEGIKDGSYFYFVHSYYVEPDEETAVAAVTSYGKNFTSAIARDNLWGVQFHPEKSGANGLKILGNFIKKCSENV